MAGEDPKTEELRIDQGEREAKEQRRAKRAQSKDEADQHDRRAAKSAYLRRKLEERADAEREE